MTSNPQSRRPGESLFLQWSAEAEINKLTEQLIRWRKSIASANPSDERLPRARTALAYYENELSTWRHAFLEAWRPDHKSN